MVLILKILIKKQRKRPEGRPKLASKIKQKHMLTINASIEEKSIIETYIKKFSEENKIHLSPSKYIKTIIPYLNRSFRRELERIENTEKLKLIN